MQNFWNAKRKLSGASVCRSLSAPQDTWLQLSCNIRCPRRKKNNNTLFISFFCSAVSLHSYVWLRPQLKEGSNTNESSHRPVVCVCCVAQQAFFITHPHFFFFFMLKFGECKSGGTLEPILRACVWACVSVSVLNSLLSWCSKVILSLWGLCLIICSQLEIALSG